VQESHITAGIFDLGGVLIDWNPRYLYRKLFAGDDAAMERFLAEVTTPAWNRQMDGGRPFSEAIAELQREHPHHAELIQAYFDRWPEMIGEVNADAAAIIRELRAAGLRVFALSDWSAETFPLARRVAAELELFDNILISGEARLTKPDPRLFALACERFGVVPAETFFVDDAPANIEGARLFGLAAIPFTDAAALREALSALGVL